MSMQGMVMQSLWDRWQTWIAQKQEMQDIMSCHDDPACPRTDSHAMPQCEGVTHTWREQDTLQGHLRPLNIAGTQTDTPTGKQHQRTQLQTIQDTCCAAAMRCYNCTNHQQQCPAQKAVMPHDNTAPTTPRTNYVHPHPQTQTFWTPATPTSYRSSTTAETPHALHLQKQDTSALLRSLYARPAKPTFGCPAASQPT